MLFCCILITLSVSTLSKSTGIPVDPDERLAEDGNHGGQKLCANYECPDYMVINKTREFEIRKYPPYKYVVAYEEGLNFSQARNNNFLKLRRYISGANNLRTKIKKAHPVFNRFVIGGNGKVGNLYAMSFFLPKEYQANPPKPFNVRDVEIVDVPETVAFVQPFNGYASERKILQRQQMLKDSLYYTNLDYDPIVFYSAEYNEPWQYFDRYNEIVLVKMKNQKVL